MARLVPGTAAARRKRPSTYKGSVKQGKAMAKKAANNGRNDPRAGRSTGVQRKPKSFSMNADKRPTSGKAFKKPKRR